MASCAQIGFTKAVNIWWAGDKLENYCIYFANVIWLGRIAKIIAYIAALPIIIDLAGEDRTEKFLNYFRNARQEELGSMFGSIKNRNNIIFLMMFHFHKYFIFLMTVSTAIVYTAVIWKFSEIITGNILTVEWYWLDYIISKSFWLLLPVLLTIIIYNTICLLADKRFVWYVRFTAFLMLAASVFLDLLAS